MTPSHEHILHQYKVASKPQQYLITLSNNYPMTSQARMLWSVAIAMSNETKQKKKWSL